MSHVKNIDMKKYHLILQILEIGSAGWFWKSLIYFQRYKYFYIFHFLFDNKNSVFQKMHPAF